MFKKNSKFDLKHLILYRLAEAEEIKAENARKNKAFEAYSQELHKQIHKNGDQFNDI